MIMRKEVWKKGKIKYSNVGSTYAEYMNQSTKT